MKGQRSFWFLKLSKWAFVGKVFISIHITGICYVIVLKYRLETGLLGLQSQFEKWNPKKTRKVDSKSWPKCRLEQVRANWLVRVLQCRIVWYLRKFQVSTKLWNGKILIKDSKKKYISNESEAYLPV